MKVKLPDPEFFNIKDVSIAGEECVLVTPKTLSVEWNNENKMFRSSVWRKSDLHPVSLGFRKFVNLGEQPNFEPWDETNNQFWAITKVDGSCLIVSKYNGELIIRTRGTIDASVLQNGSEISLLKEKYLKVFDNRHLNKENVSFLYEWTTPSNQIVLKESATPTLKLIGVVYHKDYSYVAQDVLDRLSLELEVPRPNIVDMSLKNIRELMETEKNIEGVVLYSSNGQTLKKLKTKHYLYLHKIYTGLKTLDQLCGLWKESGYLEIEGFKRYLSDRFGFELLSVIDELIIQLDNKWSLIKAKLIEIKSFVNDEEFQLLDRREQASLIHTSCKDWSFVAFNFLDGKFNLPEKLIHLV